MKFSKQRTVNRVVLLDVNEITSSPYQPRRQFDPKGMKELADSISQSGLLQPITVRRTETGYELIAGERRLMACRMLHLDKIPAIVEQFDDEKSAVFSLVENLQRKDLNYFEEAVGIQQLMQRCEMTQQQVAERLGKAQSTVANKLRLLTFSEPLRRRMLDAGLTERHARALLRLKSEEARLEAVRRADEQGLSVRQLEALIERMQKADTGRVKLFFRDERMFVNTVLEAVKALRRAGVNARSHIVDREKAIDVVVTLPKIASRRVSKGESPSGGRT